MIQLRQDLFVKLAIAAKRHKESALVGQIRQRQANLISGLETFDYEPPKPLIEPLLAPKTMDQTIEEIVENPQVQALKKELSKVEEIFEKLKESGDDLDVIMRIEGKIDQLKRLIDEKSY